MQTLARVQPRPPMTLEDLLARDIARAWVLSSKSTFVYVTPVIKAGTMSWLALRTRSGAEACCLYVGGDAPPGGLTSVPVLDYSDQFRCEEPASGATEDSGFHA